MPDIDILIPCKSFAHGKMRLSSVLEPAQRAQLCRAFLRHTITTALTLQPRHVFVLSAEPVVGAFARELGAETIPDFGEGLNAAIEHARGSIRATASCNRLMVLPIDLPNVDADVLNSAIARETGVVIAPNLMREGTNMLLLAPETLDFQFRFGPGSFASHRHQAQTCGYSVAVVNDDRLAFDVDEPEDYDRLIREQRRPFG